MKNLSKSLLKISVATLFMVAALNVGRVSGTNSFFTATAGANGVSFSAGWWVKPDITFDNFDSDTWQVGATENLKWKVQLGDSKASVTDLKLEYTCDGGKSFDTIKEFSDDPGSYDWTVPDNISDQCQIKMEVTDSHELTNSQESGKFGISWMVVLNEIMPKPAFGSEWVEFYNMGGQAVDMSNWQISELTASGSENKYKISSLGIYEGPSDYKIQPKDFLAVKFSGSKLNDTGDTVTLYDPDGNRIDWHKYVASDVKEGKSIARMPDGTGDWIDPVPTPGEKNTGDNDQSDFKKYYSKVCFGKHGRPICSEDFLKSLDLWNGKSASGGNHGTSGNPFRGQAEVNNLPETTGNGQEGSGNPPAGDGAPDGHRHGGWKQNPSSQGDPNSVGDGTWRSKIGQAGFQRHRGWNKIHKTFDSASKGSDSSTGGDSSALVPSGN